MISFIIFSELDFEAMRRKKRANSLSSGHFIPCVLIPLNLELGHVERESHTC